MRYTTCMRALHMPLLLNAMVQAFSSRFDADEDRKWHRQAAS